MPKPKEAQLEVLGARVHNLKNIDVCIPRNKFVVITGLSGSGKSSLAFDTIYAEGQRRYIETFSAYARQFIGNMERPDVDKITGLSPVISIEQKTTSKNPRSTVGTITEIYDFLRLLYARIADPYSYVTNKKMVKYSEPDITDLIINDYHEKNIIILAPVVKRRKGHYRDLFEQIRRKGFLKVRIDGEMQEIGFGMHLDRYKVHDIDIVIDKLVMDGSDSSYNRLRQSMQIALREAKDVLSVLDVATNEVRLFSKNLMCLESGISYSQPEPNTFSFNSNYGACTECNGLGMISVIDIDKIIPDRSKSINEEGIVVIGKSKKSWIYRQLEAVGAKNGFTMDTPISKFSNEALKVVLNGAENMYKVRVDDDSKGYKYAMNFEGIINFMSKQYEMAPTSSLKKWISGYMNRKPCSVCNGDRLKKESLFFKIDDNSIADAANMELSDLYVWLESLENKLTGNKQIIGKEILRELKTRLYFLLEVGLNYLSLNRPSKTLSGGESQRIRLATQIGSKLTGVLYILDEPSIGLHQKDNRKLIHALHELKDIGNSVLIVEHDMDTIMAADYVVDIGPGAGKQGGEIIGAAPPQEFINCNTLTADYLKGKKYIEYKKTRRKGNGKEIFLKGASGNNLKNVDLKVYLGKMICVTGVSGSGKSSLINETLYPIISKKFYRSEKTPLPYDEISGLEFIDKIIEVDQSPIGRTPRSNPATYIGAFDEIRKLYAGMPESKIRGYKLGRFSFNVSGGRCETCKGAGVKTIEMNFLPDVYVLCDDCQGKRYNRETLEIRFKGKSINDVLELKINEAADFFSSIPKIHQKLAMLKEVGLGYITLGQRSTTLSGGEAQRVKLSSELSKRDTGKTLYIMDEPTTGLHFEDVKVLLDVINTLVDKGNTVIIIEHNMDVIKCADYIIDIGPDGGDKGGVILCEGTPEEIKEHENSYTAEYLRELMTS